MPDINNLDENPDLYLAPGMDIKADGPVQPPKVPDRASVVSCKKMDLEGLEAVRAGETNG